MVGYAEVNAINPPSYTLNHAFLYSNGTMIDLESPPAKPVPYGINDAGQVVGETTLDYPQHAFLFTAGTGMTTLARSPRRSTRAAPPSASTRPAVVGDLLTSGSGTPRTTLSSTATARCRT